MTIVIYRQFYLLVTTLTVVGYGTDNPSFSKNANDTALLIAIILFGIIAFTMQTADLNILFSSLAETISISAKQLQIEERLEFYFIKHNRMWGVRKLTSDDLVLQKKVSGFQYHFNFSSIYDESTFQELTP